MFDEIGEDEVEEYKITEDKIVDEVNNSLIENDVSTGSYSKSPTQKMKDKKMSKDDNMIENQEKQMLTGGGINKMNTLGSKTSPIKIKGYTSNKVGGPIINNPIKVKVNPTKSKWNRINNITIEATYL